MDLSVRPCPFDRLPSINSGQAGQVGPAIHPRKIYNGVKKLRNDKEWKL